MIKQLIFGVVAFFALVSFACAGDAPSIKEGLWETTVKIDSPGLEMHFPPFKSTQCITQTDAAPQSSQPGADSCKVTDQKISGNTVSWTMTCDASKSGYTSGTGTVTYTGDTFTGKLVIKGEKDLEFTSNMTGKYLGPCKK